MDGHKVLADGCLCSNKKDNRYCLSNIKEKQKISVCYSLHTLLAQFGFPFLTRWGLFYKIVTLATKLTFIFLKKPFGINSSPSLLHADVTQGQTDFSSQILLLSSTVKHLQSDTLFTGRISVIQDWAEISTGHIKLDKHASQKISKTLSNSDSRHRLSEATSAIVTGT